MRLSKMQPLLRLCLGPFILLCSGYLHLSLGQVTECQCWIPSRDRFPCEEGASLPESECVDAGCCYLFEQTQERGAGQTPPVCYKARDHCHQLPHCHVKPEQRRPCSRVHDSAGDKFCQFRGCCYDETYIPSCYRALSTFDGPGYHDGTIHASSMPSTSTSSGIFPSIIGTLSDVNGSIHDVMSEQMTNIEESVAFKSSIAMLGNDIKVLIQCVFGPTSSPCGWQGISVHQCVARMCCYNPSLESTYSCVYPKIMRLPDGMLRTLLQPPKDQEVQSSTEPPRPKEENELSKAEDQEVQGSTEPPRPKEENGLSKAEDQEVQGSTEPPRPKEENGLSKAEDQEVQGSTEPPRPKEENGLSKAEDQEVQGGKETSRLKEENELSNSDDEEVQSGAETPIPKEEHDLSQDEIIPNGKLGIFNKTCRVIGKREPCQATATDSIGCHNHFCCWDHSSELCHAPLISYHPFSANAESYSPGSFVWSRQKEPTSKDIKTDLLTSVIPVNEFSYENFSIIVLCPSKDDAEICAVDVSREVCLSLFCCWMNGSPNDSRNGTCIRPKVEFVEPPADDESTILEKTGYTTQKDPIFWLPSLPVRQMVVDDIVITSQCLPVSKNKLNKGNMKCGGEDIQTRDECVTKGCCWRPWLFFDLADSLVCQDPTVHRRNISAAALRDSVPSIPDYITAYWDKWDIWSVCTPIDRCGVDGRQSRSRGCISAKDEILDNKITAEEASQCLGAATEVRVCKHIADCDSNPDWLSEWSDWSDCSESCQMGENVRTRVCQPPEGCPQRNSGGGDLQTETRRCNTGMCEVWRNWMGKQDCDAECKSYGNTTEIRTCEIFNSTRNYVGETIVLKSNVVANVDIGDQVVALQQEVFDAHPEECFLRVTKCFNENECLHQWDSWGNWTNCDEECTPGTRQRSRRCVRVTIKQGRIGALPELCSAALGGRATENGRCGIGRCERWGEWVHVERCDAKCGEMGNVEEQRLCRIGQFLATAQSEHCFKRIGTCRGPPCPMGRWSKWTDWSECDSKCSPVNITRTRKCFNSNTGDEDTTGLCKGATIESKLCNIGFCQRWGNWTEGDCKSRCDARGEKRSTRVCLDFEHPGDPEQESSLIEVPKSCYSKSNPCIRKCKIRWGEWNEWSKCSEECSPGSRRRTHACVREDGVSMISRLCPGGESEWEQTEDCNTQMCSEWNAWQRGRCIGNCKKGGMRNLTRSCVGQDISWVVETYEAKQECYAKNSSCKPKCARWGRWTDYGECSSTCSSGKKTRRRLCMRGKKIVPITQCRPNQGELIEEKDCNIFLCSSYGPWRDSYLCNGTCEEGIGTRMRTRDCYSGDAPAHCLVGTDSCRPRCGPGWGPWSHWLRCSEKCGPGNKTRTRECLDGDEKVEPSECMAIKKNGLGGSEEVEDCNTNYCHTWSAWENSICPAECNVTGIMIRKRLCLDNSPGTYVPGECWTSEFICTGECLPRWMPWTAWTHCSADCGPGRQVSVRRCLENGIIINPQLCSSDRRPRTVRYRGCKTNMCDSWTKWKVGPCAVQCGGAGVAIRERKCIGKGDISTAEQPTDTNCYRRQEICGNDPCPHLYKPWSDWSECSSLCSPGVKKRTRQCVTEGFQFGDCSSLGPSVQTRDCNSEMCQRWKPWKITRDCTLNGIRQQRRSCEQDMRVSQMRNVHPVECYDGEISCN